MVGMTLDRLAAQATLYARGEAAEPWIATGQLRDDVLRDELRRSRRQKLWNRVRTIVEGNANVRAAVRESRGGDVSRVWEWIGGIGGLAGELDTPGSGRRESGRVRFSLSPTNNMGGAGAGASPAVDGGARTMKKWEENSRPVY